MEARPVEVLRWLGLAAAAGILAGCATVAAVSFDPKGRHPDAVFSDTIIAIGHPDATLRKEMGQDDLLVLVGTNKTYLLHKGGAELNTLSTLKLEPGNIDIEPTEGSRLYTKDGRVWGELLITYKGGTNISDAEEAELAKGGYTPVWSMPGRFERRVAVEGTVCPPLNIPDEQWSRLKAYRSVYFYAPGERNNSAALLRKIVKVPELAISVAVDATISPVFGVAGLLIAAKAVADQR